MTTTPTVTLDLSHAMELSLYIGHYMDMIALANTIVGKSVDLERLRNVAGQLDEKIVEQLHKEV